MHYPRRIEKAFSESSETRTEYLKQFRKDHEMTQADLADLTNTSLRTVEGWESRRNTPKAIAALLARIDDIEEFEGLFYV